MMKLIIRADDFGFSEAVNYGVMKAYRGGLVKKHRIDEQYALCRACLSLDKR